MNTTPVREHPCYAYISGDKQYSLLQNPRKPLESPIHPDETKDAAWWREYLADQLPPIEPDHGPVPPDPTYTKYTIEEDGETYATLYPDTTHPDNKKKNHTPELLGIIPNLEQHIQYLDPDNPTIHNKLDCVIIHSDYFTQICNTYRNDSELTTLFTYLDGILQENLLLIIEASTNAEDNADYREIYNKYTDTLNERNVPLGYRPITVTQTILNRDNPSAPYKELHPDTVAENLYKAIELFLDPTQNPDPYTEPSRAFKGTLTHRTTPNLAAIHQTANPDETHLNNSPNLGRVITVSSKKGGTGKTTTALALAHALSKWGKEAEENGHAPHALKVIVVDLDLLDGQVGYSTNNQTQTVLGIFNTYRETYSVLGEDPDEDWNIIQQSIIHTTQGFDTLLPPENHNNLNDLDPAFYRAIVTVLREHYDIIIFDTSVSLESAYMTQCAYPLAYRLYYATAPHHRVLDTMRKQFTYGLGSTIRGGGGLNPQRIRIFVNGVEAPHIVQKKSAVAFKDVANYSVSNIPVLSGVPYLHEAALDSYNPHLPEGFGYLLKNQGYEAGMKILAHDILRDTNYQLFNNEDTQQLEHYFTLRNL